MFQVEACGLARLIAHPSSGTLDATSS